MNPIYENQRPLLSIVSRVGLLLLLLITSCFITHAQSWSIVGYPDFSAGEAGQTTIAIDHGGAPYVAFSDQANGYKATVMKYSGLKWVDIGVAGFSAGSIFSPQIALGKNDTPYIVYTDRAYQGRITVMKFDGTNWVNVGSPGFSDTLTAFTRIAIDTVGTPYVVYADFGNRSDMVANGRATVMKFNGTTWDTVGNTKFSPGIVNFTDIAIGKDNKPIVLFQDLIFDYASVMTFDGSNWVYIGAPDFTNIQADYLSLAVDRSGTPYVAYREGDNFTEKATVMKFDGTAWVVVGVNNFSPGNVAGTNIAIDSSGIPYVSFTDLNAGYKLTVMKFVSGSWTTVGSAGFSIDEVDASAIAIDLKGVPYVVYADNLHSGKATVESIHSPTEVNNVVAASHVNVSPNPAQKELNITASYKINTLTISNIFGQLVFSGDYYSDKIHVDISTLPTGIFIVKTNESDVNTFVKN